MIDEELQPEKWNNIPVPITNGMQTVMKCLRNLENHIKLVNTEQRSRCDTIAKKFKVIEKLGHERDD